MPPLNGALIRERLHDGKTHAPERTNQASYEFHPVAEMFPLLQGKDFDALVEDIRHYGLIYPIIVYEDQILEGRNRYRACLAAKVERRFEQFTGDDPKAYVISANIRRRHLTVRERERLLIELIASNPGKSDRQIGRETGVDGKTIAKARRKGEDVRSIPHVEKRTDSKGRSQPARKKSVNSPASTSDLMKGQENQIVDRQLDDVKMAIERLVENARKCNRDRQVIDTLRSYLDETESVGGEIWHEA